MRKDPEDYSQRQNKIERDARKIFGETDFEKGRSAASGASGEVTTEGVEGALKNIGIEKSEDSTPAERTNEMLYVVSNDSRADRFNAFMNKKPSDRIEKRHEETGLASYKGGFQFLTNDGRTIKNEFERLEEETDVNVGSIAASLTMNSGADSPSSRIELYQEIKSGDYDTQRELAKSVGVDEPETSRTLNRWRDEGLVEENALELTEDGYEVSKTLRGLESYAEHNQ